MARSILATGAMTDYCQLSDDQGRLVLFPQAAIDALRRSGQRSLTLTIDLTDGKPNNWIDIGEAVEQLQQDVDDLADDAARMRISRACKQGQIEHAKDGKALRIETVSFKAWRLDQREKNLNSIDE